MCVDLLVRFRLAVAEVDERLPADEAPGRAGAAGQVVAIVFAELSGVEDETEEGLAVVAREIRTIGGPDHAVAEAVGPV